MSDKFSEQQEARDPSSEAEELFPDTEGNGFPEGIEMPEEVAVSSASEIRETEIAAPKAIDEKIDKKPLYKKALLFVPLLLVTVGIGAIALNRIRNPGPPDEPEPEIVEQSRLPVRAVPIRIASIREWVSGDGYARAVRSKHLSFEISGTVEYITKVDGRDLKEGDSVFGGELLAQVDDRTLQADLAESEAGAAEALEQESTALAQRQQASAQVEQARAQVEQAQAQVEQAQAQVDQQQASIVSANAQRRQALARVEQAQADLRSAEASRELAQKDLERYRGLVEQGIETRRQLEVSESQFQQAQAQVAAAEAGVRSASEEVATAEAAIESAQSQVVAAQSQVVAAGRNVEALASNATALESNATALESNVTAADAQINAAQAGIFSAETRVTRSEVGIEDSQIVAPFDGIVAYLNIREGEYWSTQIVNTSTYQNVVESVPIIVIDPSEFEVDLELPAFQGSTVKPGQQAIVLREEDVSEAQAGNLADEELRQRAIAEGRVFSVSPSVTPGGRSVKVTVRIPQGTANLKHGARVVTWIAVQESPRTTVAPVNAFVYRDRQPYVFVVRPDGTVKQQAVEIGIEGFSDREILSQVQPDSLVVTEGKDRLVDGTPVEVVD